MSSRFLLYLLLALIYDTTAYTATYHELYRPGYHYSCPQNWMNDPNGLIYHNGVYHMYYQYNPYGTIWGNMSWGHATSVDLIHWINLPVAIPLYADIFIFSGSIISDVNNTSGFCSSPGCMLAFYTAQGYNNESQNLAYSNDNGSTFTQYAGNPIIDLNKAAFRDPKAFWYAPQQKWIMVTALSDDFKLRLYTSTNLRDWTQLSDFGPQGSSAGVWEDPDLFLLNIEGESTQKWVLVHSVATEIVEYYIGDFDGTTFTNTETLGLSLFIDYGRDFTEAASWNDEPKGRRLMIAWMNNGPYGDFIPETGWRGQFSLIRDLSIRRYPEGLRVVQKPIDELTTLRVSLITLQNIQLDAVNQPLVNLKTGNQLEIIAVFEFPTDTNLTPTEFGIKVFVGHNQSTTIGYKVQSQMLFIDRTKSGDVIFYSNFASVSNCTLAPENRVIQLHIFVDQSSVEVFGNNGKVAITSVIYPDPSQNQAQAYVTGGSMTISSSNIWELNNIWDKTQTNTKAGKDSSLPFATIFSLLFTVFMVTI